ncbi:MULTISPECIES: hypothetical protein [Arenibacter]|nr:MULTISPECIES: hypothetical protein [Arenibacter]
MAKRGVTNYNIQWFHNNLDYRSPIYFELELHGMPVLKKENNNYF